MDSKRQAQLDALDRAIDAAGTAPAATEPRYPCVVCGEVHDLEALPSLVSSLIIITAMTFFVALWIMLP